MFVSMLVLASSAQAQTCTSDAECTSGMCVSFDAFLDSDCPWWLEIWGLCPDLELGNHQQCATTVVHLENELTGDCARPTGGSTAIGAVITRDSCVNTRSRDWGMLSVSGGATLLANEWSDLCMTLTTAGFVQQRCSDISSQRFIIDPDHGATNRLWLNTIDDECVRAHPTVTDLFLSDTCDVNNTSSRHWFFN